MDGSIHEGKSSFKMLGSTFSSKSSWGSYIISIAKTPSWKIGALICFMKFLSPGVALYLYKSTTDIYIPYCCHVWAGAHSCYLQILDKIQKQICRTVGPSLDPLLSTWLIIDMQLLYTFSVGTTLLDVQMNWLTWFYCLNPEISPRKKKFTERKIWRNQGSKAAEGNLWGTASLPNRVMVAGVEPQKILNFPNFHIPREAISDLFSS